MSGYGTTPYGAGLFGGGGLPPAVHPIAATLTSRAAALKATSRAASVTATSRAGALGIHMR